MPIETITVAPNIVPSLTAVAVDHDADEPRIHGERHDDLHADDGAMTGPVSAA